MTIEEALRSTIDANIYFLLDPREQNGELHRDFCIAIGLPFVRPDDKWEFRFLRLHASRIDLKGDWDEDACSGWGIELVAFSPTTLEFVGDEISLLIQLIGRGGPVGSVARAYLDQWPDSEINDDSEHRLYLSALFFDKTVEWCDLLPSTMANEYR